MKTTALAEAVAEAEEMRAEAAIMPTLTLTLTPNP